MEIPQSAFLLFGYGIGSNLSNNKSTPFGVKGLKSYFVEFIGAGPSSTTEYAEITDDDYTYNGIINSNVLSKVNVYKPKSSSETSPLFASFSSTVEYPVPSDVSVYKAKVSGEYVVLTKVNTESIPANTGVILKKNADDENTATGADTSFDGNELIPTSVEANATVPTEGTYYALVAGEATFGVLKGGIILSSNKAYIKAPETASEAKTILSIKFGDDTTGINAAKVKTAEADNAYYTLQGVKTMKPAKGLYIHNGKKVIVK